MAAKQKASAGIECGNYIGGAWSQTAANPIAIHSPWNGAAIGKLWPATKKELDAAVSKAKIAQQDWAAVPIKERSEVLFRVREYLLEHISGISATISSESGKLVSEAEAGLRKGIEVLEFALSLQNLDRGGKMEVSRGVFCEARREPLGVVAGITPFNFPAMVPMWMIPIAITLGNSFIWKPSDKTPLTSVKIAEAFARAGLPAGVLSTINGGKEIVEAICDHPGIAALGFVGSTPVARAVYERATKNGKRALTLGGAKNHIILMPDADADIAAAGIAASFTGCAGQRCMAASVVLAVGGVDKILDAVVARVKKIKLGIEMGAIISADSVARLEKAIARAGKAGAKILVDGRGARATGDSKNGNWLGPTILDNVADGSEAAREELFGPVLSIIRVKNLSGALAIAAQSEYGNACSVFTSSGAVAEEVARRSTAGMIGINVGVPVPREPFSFGGTLASKFGTGDITGESSLGLWTNLKKITTKWQLQADQNWMS